VSYFYGVQILRCADKVYTGFQIPTYSSGRGWFSRQIKNKSSDCNKIVDYIFFCFGFSTVPTCIYCMRIYLRGCVLISPHYVYQLFFNYLDPERSLKTIRTEHPLIILYFLTQNNRLFLCCSVFFCIRCRRLYTWIIRYYIKLLL